MAREKKGKIITVTSMKGGVGKTTTTLLLASIYRSLNKKVLLIDLDLYTGSTAFVLNADIKANIFNVCDDIRNNHYKGITAGEYLYSHEEGLDLIAAPKDPRQAGKIDKRCLEVLLNGINNYYDVILIDTNHILDMYNTIAFEYSDWIINLFTNDAIDLKNTKTFVSICKNIGVENMLLVLNGANDDRKKYFSLYDIKGIVKHNIDYSIPSSLHIKNYDMYVMEGTIMKYLSKLETSSKKNYAEVKKLALKLLSDREESEKDEKK